MTLAINGVWDGRAVAQQVTQSLTVAATFGPRTSLQQSTRVLTFQVTGTMAEASIDFTAGARVPSGTRVDLVAEIDATFAGAMAIVAGPEGTIPGPVTLSATTVAASWLGSGRRAGRLTFRLEAAPGLHTIQVNLRLATDDSTDD